VTIGRHLSTSLSGYVEQLRAAALEAIGTRSGLAGTVGYGRAQLDTSRDDLRLLETSRANQVLVTAAALSAPA